MTTESYDFAAPPSLPAGVKQGMESWISAFSAQARNDWPRQLPYALNPSLQDLRSVRADVALAGLAENVLGIDVLLNQTLRSMLILPRPLLLLLVGGLVGEEMTEMPEDRELTGVEDSLADHAIRHLFLNPLQENWRAELSLSLEAGERELVPRWSKTFHRDESLVICDLMMEAPFGQQQWQWLFPRRGFEDLLASELDPKSTLSPEERSSRLSTLIQDVVVPVTVTLGSVELPVSQLADLRVGDVLVLDQRIQDRLLTTVAGKEMFQGYPGRLGLQQAFRIEGVITPEIRQ